MFLEVHVIQNYALSNLNRDDTGAPKTCEFGGTRRGRISSQSLKRAMRTYFRTDAVVPSTQLSYRTKRLKEALVKQLMDRKVPEEIAADLAVAAIEHLGLKLKEEKTEYLLFLGAREIDGLATIVLANQEALTGNSGKGAKVDKALQKELLGALDGGEAVDLALFGRMIADKPDKNVDAAVQMAHAISTHAIATEFDFYSAVDDLQPDDAAEGAGAGMLGTTLYNSACYYRYANLDLGQLAENLGGDRGRTAAAAEAFLRGMIHAVPSGKQTASAAQNPPALIMVTVREKGLWSLANAFVRAVRPKGNEDLVVLSTEAMLAHFGQLADLYGNDGIRHAAVATYLSLLDLPRSVSTADSVATLINGVMKALNGTVH